MHIGTHFLVGALGSVFLGDEKFLLGSIILDLPLVINEYKIRRYKYKFDPSRVSSIEIKLYRITHSLFFIPIMFYTGGIYFSIGGLIHQILDWFSHTGRFRTQILYPIYPRES